MGGFEEAEIDRLPIDLLSHIFGQRGMQGMETSCGAIYGLERETELYWLENGRSIHRSPRSPCLQSQGARHVSRSRWGCQITDVGLYQISSAKCVGNLTSISVWGMPGITDKGIVPLMMQSDENTISGISRTTSLQHLNIGGTFVTDESLFAIAESCPHLKTIVLWSCRHVTETGLSILVNKCRKLESINVWGTRVPAGCFIRLLTISPALKIKPQGQLLDVGRVSMWPIV
ncbi:unnamed protein product [Camellia sinensis]